MRRMCGVLMPDRFDTAAQLRRCLDAVRDDIPRASLHDGWIGAFALKVALLCAAAEQAASELASVRRRADVRDVQREREDG